MNFQEAEQKFRELESYWTAGRIDARAYQAALAKLCVVDSNGEMWMMQEHTARWHVLRGGNWVLMTPPPPSAPAAGRSQPAAGRSQPAVARSPSSAVQPVPPNKRRGISLMLMIGMLGACLVCGGFGLAGFLVSSGTVALPPELAGLVPKVNILTQGAQPGDASPALKADVKPAETLVVAADGTPHADSHGVALVVPPAALEEGGQVNLVANDLDAPWRKVIDPAVSIDTPFYSLSAQGKNDSNGSLTLSFPATSPNSRLLAVIDDGYLVELAQSPQDGKLTVQTRAGPTDTSGLTSPQDFDGTGSIYYAVITPKTGSHLPTGSQMVAWNRSAATIDDERNCIPDISIIGGAAINLCRQNEAGTVQVMLPTLHRDLLPQVDIMVDKVEGAMKKYNGLGFTTAQLSHSSPMLLRVSTKATSPSYYPVNGVLYIPVDTVKKMATESPTEVYHEMAHWIQAVKYSTQLAYWSQERTWWIETSAENMVMLIEPAYVGANLRTYGTISAVDNSLAFQASPYQWPADFYVQAQLVKVNLCDNPACPLSPASFAKAISEGAYPLMNGSAKALIGSNLKDYAFYLLGKTPATANSSIPLSGPVKTGEGYGEYVQINRTSDVDIKYEFNGSDPQMRNESKDGIETVVIQAAIQRDGVYPLMIVGSTGKNPGLPVELIIEPGASFYYTLDDGELKYSDGSAEIKLLPIHGGMGYKKVRIVALGVDGGEVFKARVQPLSLEGAWAVMATGTKTGGGITCSGGDMTDENPDGNGQLMAILIYLMSGTGDMQADPTGRSLDWVEVASRVPSQIKEANVTYEATALIAGEAIKYQAKINIPKAEGNSSLPPAIPISAAVILPLAWLGRKRINIKWVRVGTNLLVIAFLVLVSTGCFGMDFYGSSTVDAKFTKIEYVGGEDTGVVSFSGEKGASAPQGKPLWTLTGSGTYDVNLTFETSVTDQDGNESIEVHTCTGQITFPVTATIYKDIRVEMPPEE